MLYLIIVLCMGLFIPLQTAANARLRQAVGPVYITTFISFAVSTLSLIAVSLMSGTNVLPTVEILQSSPLWVWTGGIIALLTITCAIYLFREIGQLQGMLIPMFSQLLFSLCIDHFGWFGSTVIPFDLKRAAGAAMLIAGITLVVVLPVKRKKSEDPGTNVMRKLFWQFCAIVSGCLMASIGAIYARLGSITGSAIQASTISFIIATVVIFIYCVIAGKLISIKKAFSRKYPWWMWIGGIAGATTVFGNAWLIPKIGVGVFVMALLVGQLLLSLLMERNGWLGAPKKAITIRQIGGIAIMLAGVALIRIG